MSLAYGSVCSGIEAATAAWHPLGWTPAWFSEIEAFPSAVLAHHYPSVPNLGDMTRIGKDAGPIQLLVGGTPCQSFSVAGLRKGLADPRGNLALVFLRLVDDLRPRWVVWENVPGVLSSGGGRDFGSFLGGLGQLGYGFAYRVLDAQYVRVESHARAVPQRRRRVFVVGHLGDWRRAAAVLLERESLCGHPPPRREEGQVTAGTLASRASAGGGLGTDFDCGGGLIPFDTTQLTSVGNYSAPSPGDPCHPLSAGAHAPAIAVDYTNGLLGEVSGTLEDAQARQNRGHGVMAFYPTNRQPEFGNYEDCSPAVKPGSSTGGNPPAITFNMHKSGSTASSLGVAVGHTDCLRAFDKSPFAVQAEPHMAVRRLTPRECERLQGFPDDYTAVPYRGKPAADGPRYRALGNSMAVNVMRWIGERIALMEEAS
jgi:DNA (cytosine-5)-methyltransferase 1